MTKPTDERALLTPEEAMNAVFQAERDARQAIAGCEHEAQGVLSRARVQAQRIERRADARISGVHERCERALRRELDILRRSATGGQIDTAGPDEKVLAGLIRRLAAQLSGVDPDAGDGGDP
jgi:hypothetical protein